MDLNWEIKEGLVLDDKNKKNKTNIKTQLTGYLVSPTTHLFPLSGQSGSRGVSSIININSKYGIMKNVIKLYNLA